MFKCKNCERDCHCGSPLFEEARNWREERLGERKVCNECDCKNCNKEASEL